MVSFTKVDIILYPFSYSNLTDQKLRPCLVLSNEMGEDILLCQITSQRILKDIFSINLSKEETENATPLIDSYIRCNMLFTGNKTNLKKVICKLKKNTYLEVCKQINQIISK